MKVFDLEAVLCIGRFTQWGISQQWCVYNCCLCTHFYSLSKVKRTAFRRRSDRAYPGIDSNLQISLKYRTGPIRFDSHKVIRRNGSVTYPTSSKRSEALIKNTLIHYEPIYKFFVLSCMLYPCLFSPNI